ncbi:restriction endonuclease [Komagataeibacter sp. FNDCR2]|uniref:restriction endonuclease n=1 Tax=Komagataeibacter sp. FNDCR2 TaxID=2878682 RepID=UPI001E54C068|nr:restriction endonuclease [Komagataeibacter sp. FNDCR2]MCE2575133.1 restriction endonuclease [Komagataeibacter sp. FNDCR2]
MRVWATACLLMCLSASANAAGLFGATHPTLACGDDAVLRALSAPAPAGMQTPTARATLIRQGNCHTVTPDTRWEKIANRNGLPLMRRVPPEPGLPPLYFMTGEIAPLPAAPAGPTLPASARDAGRAPLPDTEAPSPDATAHGEETRAITPPVIVQPVETPLSSDIFFKTWGFQKLGSLILTLMLAGAGAWVLVVIVRACRRMIQRRRAAKICLEQVDRHRPMLARWHAQAQGMTARTAWDAQMAHFARMTLVPALDRHGLALLWPAIRKGVEAHMTTQAARGARKPPATPVTPEFYHPDMNQAQYAAFCSQWIEKAGWETHPPLATGLGSVIHCRRNGLKMLAHCWIDRKPVADDVILQGIREKTDSRDSIGIIISNAPYTQDALLLGRKHHIFLLHHEDVFQFASGIEVPDVA